MPPTQGALADRVDRRVARCGMPSSTTMPPRSPHRQPACAGQLVARPDARRRRPRPRRRSDRPSARATPRDRAVGAGLDDSFTAAPVCTVRPSASTWRRSTAPPPSSTWRGISQGANSTTWVVEAEAAQRVGGLQPEQPAADHGAGRGRARAACPDRVQVVDRPVDEAAGQVRARAPAARTGWSRWRAPARRTAPRGRPAVTTVRVCRSIRRPWIASRSSTTSSGHRVGEVRGAPAGQVGGQRHPVVGRPGLLAEHRDPTPSNPLPGLDQRARPAG